MRPFYTDVGVSEKGLRQLAHAQPFRDYLYVSPLGTRLFQCTLSPVERLLCAASRLEELAVLETLAAQVSPDMLPAAWLRHWGYDEEAAFLMPEEGDVRCSRTIITIVISAALGSGSTLLVQTVILQPAPVGRGLSRGATVAEQSPGALRELDGTYQPQGRFLPMPGAQERELGMRHGRMLSLLLCLLLLPRLSLAEGLARCSTRPLNTLGIQQQWIQLKELYESVQHTANQMQQIENQVRQIEGMYTQIEQGARNLATPGREQCDRPARAHGTNWKASWHQAEYIGYQAQSRRDPGPQPLPTDSGCPHGGATARPDPPMGGDAARCGAGGHQYPGHPGSPGALPAAMGDDPQQGACRPGRRCKSSKHRSQAQGVIGHQLLAIEQQLATQARERSEQAMEDGQPDGDGAAPAGQGPATPGQAPTPRRGACCPWPRTGRE